MNDLIIKPMSVNTLLITYGDLSVCIHGGRGIEITNESEGVLLLGNTIKILLRNKDDCEYLEIEKLREIK